MGKNREIWSNIIDKNRSNNYLKLNMQTLLLTVPKGDKIDKTDKKWPKMAKTDQKWPK